MQHSPMDIGGEVWAQIAPGSAEDADRTVHLADEAMFKGPWQGI